MKKQYLLLLAGAGLSMSCALLGKSDPVVPRYFTPMDDTAQVAQAPSANASLRLRIGRVEGLSHLREAIVVRTSPGEVTYLEEKRWTERPEIYLRRSLERSLFRERGITEVLSGYALTLDVELTAFDEIDGPQRKVRVQLVYGLHDQRVGIAQETITVETPVADAAGKDPSDAVVAAFGEALRSGVGQLSDHVVARLAQAANPGPQR